MRASAVHTSATCLLAFLGIAGGAAARAQGPSGTNLAADGSAPVVESAPVESISEESASPIPAESDGAILNAQDWLSPDVPTTPCSIEQAAKSPYEFGYADGLFFNVRRNRDSFAARANLRTQFRFSTFSRDADSWTDNAGVVRPIYNRQIFELERARVVLAGHAFSPQLKYFLQTDGDTDSRHELAILDHWWAWRVSDAVEIQAGKRKVPGTRNWLLGAFDTRLIDRPFANEFFRPSRTTGIWVVGDPSSVWHYELMIGQGFSTEGLTPAEVSDQFSGAASAWWNLLGDYGPGRPTDYERHDELAVRAGCSLVSSREGRQGSQLEEADFLRLTDGTRVTDPGALAPGATVESFDVTLLALDLAFKYQGWSANGEYFWRWIENVKADLPVPSVGLQQGFYVEGGFFLVPQQWELNGQFSYVGGEQGVRKGGAVGFSYYPRNTQNFKLSADVTVLDGSPVNSTGSDVLVGDDGVLVRTQFQALF